MEANQNVRRVKSNRNCQLDECQSEFNQRGIGGWQATHLKVSKSSKMFDVLVVMRTQYSLSMIDW